MLGLEEAMDTSVSLIEWIDRAPHLAATAAVVVYLEIDGNDVDCRRCSVRWLRPVVPAPSNGGTSPC